MKGHLAIFEARSGGYTPEQVWIMVHDFAEPSEFCEASDPERSMLNGFLPEIHIYADDNLFRADLRCIAGLIAHINAPEEKSLTRVFNLAKRFKPARLFASDGQTLLVHNSEEVTA